MIGTISTSMSRRQISSRGAVNCVAVPLLSATSLSLKGDSLVTDVDQA